MALQAVRHIVAPPVHYAAKLKLPVVTGEKDGGSSGRDGWVEDCFASFLFERHVWNIESDILISHSLHEISDISEVHFNEIINPKRTNLVTGEQEIAAGYAKMFAGIYASLKPGGLCACIPWNSST